MAETAKTIAVTGGGAGIGCGVVTHFHALGWRIAALDPCRCAIMTRKMIHAS